MSPVALSREGRAASLRVFLVVFLSGAYFHQSAGHNEAARLDQMASLAEHGEWWIDRYAGNTADIIQIGEHTYPGKAPGTALLGAPLWRPLRLASSLATEDPRAQIVLVTYVLTLLMATFPTALVALLLLRFLARQGWSVNTATLMATGYGLGSLAFPWSTLLFGHQLSAAFAFAGFYLIWKTRHTDGPPPLWPRVAAGLLLGFLPVIEHPGAIASGLIGLYALRALGLRASVPFILAGVAGALPLPLYNLAAFGDPRSLGYGYYAQSGSAFPAHQVGLMGVSWPKLAVLREITFRPQRGLFYTTPWLVTMFAAPLYFRRLKANVLEYALSIAIVVAFFLFNAGYGNSIVYWGGGYSFGPRHLLIALPFAILLCALVVRSGRLAVPVGIVMAGTALLLLGVTAVDPRFPYSPGEPFRDFYLPLFARGDFAVNVSMPFGQVQTFRSTGASNFGRAIGVSRELEMMPIALMWAVALPWLFQVRSRVGRILRVVWMVTLPLVGATPALARALAEGVAEPGLCLAAFPNEARLDSPGLAVELEPGTQPIRTRVGSPRSDEPSTAEVFDANRHPAITGVFSGYFEPASEGWHLFRLAANGSAAVYLDGASRLSVSEKDPQRRLVFEYVFLTADRHEIIVKYSSAQPKRALELDVAKDGERLRPIREGLTSGACR